MCKYAEIFCWKNVSSFCSRAKATHIFSAKNIRILCIESTKIVNKTTLNELVKLTRLWTTGPWLSTECQEMTLDHTAHVHLLPLELICLSIFFNLDLNQYGELSNDILSPYVCRTGQSLHPSPQKLQMRISGSWEFIPTSSCKQKETGIKWLENTFLIDSESKLDRKVNFKPWKLPQFWNSVRKTKRLSSPLIYRMQADQLKKKTINKNKNWLFEPWSSWTEICPAFANSVDPDQLASEANWSGFALFVIQYVNLHEQTGSSYMIGWKLEVGVAA